MAGLLDFNRHVHPVTKNPEHYENAESGRLRYNKPSHSVIETWLPYDANNDQTISFDDTLEDNILRYDTSFSKAASTTNPIQNGKITYHGTITTVTANKLETTTEEHYNPVENAITLRAANQYTQPITQTAKKHHAKYEDSPHENNQRVDTIAVIGPARILNDQPVREYDSSARPQRNAFHPLTCELPRRTVVGAHILGISHA